jgi:hypothetical protein
MLCQHAFIAWRRSASIVFHDLRTLYGAKHAPDAATDMLGVPTRCPGVSATAHGTKAPLARRQQYRFFFMKRVLDDRPRRGA